MAAFARAVTHTYTQTAYQRVPTLRDNVSVWSRALLAFVRVAILLDGPKLNILLSNFGDTRRHKRCITRRARVANHGDCAQPSHRGRGASFWPIRSIVSVAPTAAQSECKEVYFHAPSVANSPRVTEERHCRSAKAILAVSDTSTPRENAII